jgi:putative protease
MSTRRTPEVLAPAGDRAALEAAMRAGADAVYFGLSQFNARARAANFDEAGLAEVLAALHARGVKGYVTLNTLVFDHELEAMARAIRTCAQAGVDAIIVQDLGVLAMARALAPGLRVHASTQMTCTDAESVLFARDHGAKRVVLARELSVEEIRTIQERCDAEGGVELEVFVHGALCIAYSGQCLTSEAIGGRSANRGACAQACRLPYTLVVDGVERPDEERAYLLSPEDLEASALVPELAQIGVASLKIEGRLKGPAYVGATTRLYREATDRLEQGEALSLEDARREALQTYSRGSGVGFLRGVDHQRLVPARGCDHRGLDVGTLRAVAPEGRRSWLVLDAIETPIARGDGLLVEGGLAGEGEVGGRVWNLELREARVWRDVERAEAGSEVRVWLGPDRIASPVALQPGPQRVQERRPRSRRRCSRGSSARHTERRCRSRSRARRRRAVYTAARRDAARGLVAEVEGDAIVDVAKKLPTSDEVLRDAMSRLGETTYALERSRSRCRGIASSRPRRSTARVARLSTRSRAGRTLIPTDVGRRDLARRRRVAAESRARRRPASTSLCRNLAQARAALAAGADGVVPRLPRAHGHGAALRALRARGRPGVGVAPPRIRKPGEEKIDRYLARSRPTRCWCASVTSARCVETRDDGPRAAWAISRST